MPPIDRFVIRFAAEPPQDTLPYGRWADTLREHFLAACRELDTEGEEIGDPGEINWYPDRTYAGRTYVPGVALVTAELANLAVDQCELVEQRFTLIAPDNYRSDFLDVKLWDKRGDELASESLYVDDDEEQSEAEAE